MYVGNFTVVNLTVGNTFFVNKNMLFSSVQSNMAQPYLALSGSPASRLTSSCEYTCYAPGNKVNQAPSVLAQPHL